MDDSEPELKFTVYCWLLRVNGNFSDTETICCSTGDVMSKCEMLCIVLPRCDIEGDMNYFNLVFNKFDITAGCEIHGLPQDLARKSWGVWNWPSGV